MGREAEGFVAVVGDGSRRCGFEVDSMESALGMNRGLRIGKLATTDCDTWAVGSVGVVWDERIRFVFAIL